MRGSRFTASTRATPGGSIITVTAWLSRNRLARFEETRQAITAEGLGAVADWVTERRAWLDGELITDPGQAQQLWDEAADLARQEAGQ